MADAIQKGIEAAQQDLVKESEEKLLEEVQISCSPSKLTNLCNWKICSTKIFIIIRIFPGTLTLEEYWTKR